jgi:osmotically-inducible protein OsmY
MKVREEATMVLLFQTYAGPDDNGERGHSEASTRAAIESALAADAELDCSEITVTMLGSYAVLEGFVHSAGELVNAMLIAEDVVGKGNVHSRLLRREDGS